MVTNEVVKIMELAEEKRWGFRYVGEGDMPSSTFRVGNWEFSPLLDYSNTPPRVQQRIKAVLKEASVQGFVIAHDHFVSPRALLTGAQPKLLPPPPKPEPIHIPAEPEKPQTTTPKAGLSQAATGAFSAAFFLLNATFKIIWAVGSAMVWLFASVLMMDPVVFAILEDGSVIEVARWYE